MSFGSGGAEAGIDLKQLIAMRFGSINWTHAHLSRGERLYFDSRRMVARSTSKMTAVDQPNNSTPFIAVIGASNRQCSNGITSP